MLALDPTLAGTPGLVTAMTNRTNFVWNANWDYAGEREPDEIHFEFITEGSAAIPAVGIAPVVDWVVDDNSAVRIHLANPEGEWRCALLILKPSTTAIQADMGATPELAAGKAAQIRGIWYDGGSGISATYTGLHDCSPVGNASGYNCAQAVATLAITDLCLPEDAQTWNIADLAARVDNSSVGSGALLMGVPAAAANDVRSLHRSTASLDSNA